MARQRTHQEIIDLLGRAVGQAQHAEAYHAAAADAGALKGRTAQQAACDASAMQLIELAGCAEDFKCDRGEPGTTLARFDDALRPAIRSRMELTHPEHFFVPPSITPRRLGGIIEHLKTAIGNLDSDTLKIEAPDQKQALNAIIVGLLRIEKDGLADPEALRARDLHYAGYYHEIQFGRLAKATGLYDNMGKSLDARKKDVNACIFDADDMAHRFHEMRGGFDKSRLPVSVVSPEHRERVPGRSLSALMRELRHESQSPAERRAEVERTAEAKAREEHRDAVEGLAATYARITGDPEAAAGIRDYVRRRERRLDPETVREMRRAVEIAASPDGDYLAVPEAVRFGCLEMCLALDAQGDSRLIRILDIAGGRAGAGLTTSGGGPQQGPREAAATEEKDQYLAALLAHEPESTWVKEGLQRDVAPAPKHGRSRKNN